MDAPLGREIAIGVGARDGQRRALDARLFARREVQQLRAVALALGPARVHAQQHLRPVLRLRAAGAGVYGEDGVVAVVRAAEHQPKLQAVELLGQLGGLARQVRQGLHSFFRGGQFVQLQQVLRPLSEPVPER